VTGSVESARELKNNHA